MMGFYRKIPVVIEAFQWHLVDGAVGPIKEDYDREGMRPKGESVVSYYRIETLEGWLAVSDGDWIIRGVKDEFYPCKPDIFEATYEEVKL